MVCAKCHNDIDDSSIFCPKCGRRIQHTSHSKKLIILTVVGAVVIAIALVVSLVFLNPIACMERALNHADTDRIVELYFKYEHNEQIETKYSAILGAYTVDTAIQEQRGDIDPEEVLDFYKAISDIPKDFIQNKILVSYMLIASHQAFNDAQQLETDNDTLSAIDLYQRVIPDDKKYYDLAQERIQSLGSTIYEQARKDVRESVEKAYRLLKHLPKEFDDPDNIIDICTKYSKWCGVYNDGMANSPILTADFYINYGKLYWKAGSLIPLTSAQSYGNRLYKDLTNDIPNLFNCFLQSDCGGNILVDSGKNYCSKNYGIFRFNDDGTISFTGLNWQNKMTKFTLKKES